MYLDGLTQQLTAAQASKYVHLQQQVSAENVRFLLSYETNGKHEEVQVQQSACEPVCGTHTHTVTLYLALAGICLTGVSC